MEYRGDREVDHTRKPEDTSDWETYIIKLAAARASTALVTLITHHVPVEMSSNFRGYTKMMPGFSLPKEIVFMASGIIVESHLSSDSPPRYLCTLLAPASLFHRTPPTPLHHIEIDVFVSTGDVPHKGNLLACDFHYNLAAITIVSNIPLPTVTFKAIDDVISMDLPTLPPILYDLTFTLKAINAIPHIEPPSPPSPRLQLPRHTPTSTSFQLRPHSNLFKIYPGSPILSVYRFYSHPHSVISATGAFCSRSPKKLSCDELYHIKHNTNPGYDGGPVINSLGEVIGIIFSRVSFLPSNIVLRWWNHYKSFGKFRRPFLGMEVTNLHDADLTFLSMFITTFHNVSTAVVVAKVMEDSPAFRSKIRANDVIVSLDDKLVRSKLEFYETIWEKAGTGQAMEVKVLRVTDGEELKLHMVIEEASENNFHQWPHPDWREVR